jgi:hypothetical protein
VGAAAADIISDIPSRRALPFQFESAIALIGLSCSHLIICCGTSRQTNPSAATSSAPLPVK